ncbi:hypothetical protein DYB32_005114 [Aphanomyces invadans]|uniref:Uncharacterized protein n=1 Tax=Aphanomyces invadans TaxID=157072 RepID=A0A3R6VLD9_9STRA|nr:hypothetical protein DYB32_005114 [Aphanomyces invadans]
MRMESTTASTSALGTPSGAATSGRDNDSSIRFLSHFSSPAGSVDGNANSAFHDGAAATNVSAPPHMMYSHDEYDRSTFEGSAPSMHDDPTATSNNYDRFMDKSQHFQQQVKPWPYLHDVSGRVGRSNSFPSMDLMPYRKDATPSDLFGGAVLGAAYPRHQHSHLSPSASMHRGPAMASAGSCLPRSNSAADMGTSYEVTHGIMNATSFPEIGNNDTQKQLRTKNIPSGVLFHSGRWSNEEHNRFVEGLHQYPHGVLNRWRKISKAVGTRTVLQTRTHAQKYFRRLQKMDDSRETNPKLSADVHDDGDDGVDSENHLPNDIGHFDKASSFVRPMMGSFGSPPSSYQPKKEEPSTPQSTSVNLFQHRMSNDAYDAAPRAMMTADRHSNPPTCYPFPTITIPANHPSQQQSLSQQPTPTTEASRAFQNISLSCGARGRDDQIPFQSPQLHNPPLAQQRSLNGPGNEQWFDWLLYNIDSIPTRQNPQQQQMLHQQGRDDQGGRHHPTMTRAFRSASEPVPPLTSYRMNHASTSHLQQPQQHNDSEFATHPSSPSWNAFAQPSNSDSPASNNYYNDPSPAQEQPETKYSSLLDDAP